MGKCIIVGSGNLTPQIIKEKEDFLIAADGGFITCEEQGVKVDVLLGDFDSLPDHRRSILEEWKRERKDDLLILPTVKDDTDMMAAVKLGLERGFRQFSLYGAFGTKRPEHFIANLQTLLYLKEHQAEGTLYTADGFVKALVAESLDISSESKGFVSVLSAGDEATVSIRGMKYNIEETRITNGFPLGVSNETIGEEATIEVHSGSVFVIFSQYD